MGLRVAADADLLRRLEPDSDSLLRFAGQAEFVRCGPFRALLSDTTDWANFAEPVEAESSEAAMFAAIHDLARCFRERGRRLRILYKERRFPLLAPVLEQAGLCVLERQPLMTCVPTDFKPLVNPDVGVRFLSGTDATADLAAYQTILSESLGDGSWRETPEAIMAFRADLERGLNHNAALACLEGEAAGTGFLACSPGRCEVLSIATKPALRRRGVAATLTSFLMQDAFDRGHSLLWLEAENAVAQTLYERLGFRHMGDELTYGEPG